MFEKAVSHIAQSVKGKEIYLNERHFSLSVFTESLNSNLLFIFWVKWLVGGTFPCNMGVT
jgi:hypothetical protein